MMFFLYLLHVFLQLSCETVKSGKHRQSSLLWTFLMTLDWTWQNYRVKYCIFHGFSDASLRIHVKLVTLRWVGIWCEYTIYYFVNAVAVLLLNHLTAYASHVLTVDYAPNQEATSLLHGPIFDLLAELFAVSAPYAWNSLPIDSRDCSSEATYKKHLKTFLFHVAFN